MCVCACLTYRLYDPGHCRSCQTKQIFSFQVNWEELQGPAGGSHLWYWFQYLVPNSCRQIVERITNINSKTVQQNSLTELPFRATSEFYPTTSQREKMDLLLVFINLNPVVTGYYWIQVLQTHLDFHRQCFSFWLYLLLFIFIIDTFKDLHLY